MVCMFNEVFYFCVMCETVCCVRCPASVRFLSFLLSLAVTGMIFIVLGFVHKVGIMNPFTHTHG